MIGNGLLEFASQGLGSGQGQLAHHIKLEISQSGHQLAELLDFSHDSVFLEPSLFGFFSDPDPSLTLEQLLYGAVPVDARPSVIEAYVDDDGIIDLPGYGQLITEEHRKCAIAISLETPSPQIAHRAPQHIAGTDIQYARRLNPLFARLCADDATSSKSRDHGKAIAHALRHLQQSTPTLHRCLVAVTREIVTFAADDTESFASLAAHGGAFLQTDDDVDEVFFVEDLAHQCGHILFNALTLDAGKFLSIDPKTPLAELGGLASDPRSIMVALHGVFTECLMSIAMAECLNAKVFDDPRQTHELIGRLSYIMKRFEGDLLHVRIPDIYTSVGDDLLNRFGEVFDQVFESAKKAIVGCDLSHQPYSFSYEQFAANNRSPLP